MNQPLNRPWAAVIFVAFMAATGSRAAPQSDAEIRTNIYKVFKQGVLGVGRFDGESVVDVQAPNDCTTIFTTRKGATTVDFRNVKPPFAAHTEAHDQLTTLPDEHGSLHRFTTPKGSRGRDLQTAMYFSYMQCSQSKAQ